MRKVTVSMPDEVADGVQAVVNGGGAASFSAFVAEATRVRLDREVAVARYRSFTGGPVGGELRARAERALGVGQDEAEPETGSAPAADGGSGVPGGAGASGAGHQLSRRAS